MVKTEINRAERHFDETVSVGSQFSEHLWKWTDASLPDMYDHNAFVYSEGVTAEEIAAAKGFQKGKQLNFLKLEGDFPLSDDVLCRFSLEKGETLTMALSADAPLWKQNEQVIIREITEPGVEEDILALQLRNYAEDYGADFCTRQLRRYAEMARKAQGLRYFAAYLDGNCVGACYVFYDGGTVGADGLIVDSEVRKQYVATTLLSHIRTSADGIFYLHADAEDTPKDMYARMGFVVVDQLYEYDEI